MFPGYPVDFLTVYLLSGWFGNAYETWKGTLNRHLATPDTLSFTVYLVWPLTEDPEEALITIKKTDAGLTLRCDWFPDEEFPLQPFFSPDRTQVLLFCLWERETMFLHLK
ncbi:MAG: hypothetical protein FJ128_11025 [Deltaproteobacteria bacterium]|nr:hypothetical protein [Deltaproteobacteria bacterium]